MVVTDVDTVSDKKSENARTEDLDSNESHSSKNIENHDTNESEPSESTSADSSYVGADTGDSSTQNNDDPYAGIAPASAYKQDDVESDGGSSPRLEMRSHIHDGAGSGVLTGTEGWVQENSREPQNDGRSHTRTYFNPNDTKQKYPGGQKHRDPQDRRSWATLAGWQDGVQSDKSRGAQNWWADKKRWVDIFADQMAASEYHKTRCQHVIEELTMSDYKPDRVPAELIIIGILSLLIDNEITDFENRALKRGNTQSLLEDINADVGDYEKIRSKLKKRDGDLIFGN